MADTAKLGITKVEVSQSQKEVTVNAGLDKIDTAIAGQASVSIAGGAGDQTLADDVELNSAITLTGTITGNRNVIVSMGKKWHFYNGTDGGFTVTVKRATGTGVAIPAGEWREVMNDGTNVVEVGGGGGGGGGTWGGITGTLADQTDLQSALDAKATPSDITSALAALEFVDLDDVPSLSGQGLKLWRVKSDESGMELADAIDALSASVSVVVGDGTEDTFSIEHGFGSLDLLVVVREAVDSGADGYIRVDTGYEVRFYDENTVQVIFDSPPSAGQYSIFVALPWIRGEQPVSSPGSSTYASPGEYEFVVPPGVDELTVKMWGAGGGGCIFTPSAISTAGGGGGFAQATVSVTAGEVLTVKVGAGGVGYTWTTNTTWFNNGGKLTGLLRGSTPLVIAGSGGGAGICASSDAADHTDGGPGGGSSGGDAEASGVATGHGKGGTQVGGGAGGTGTGASGTSGSSLTGGIGGSQTAATNDGYGGGGGDGYYGGGGGIGDDDATANNTDGYGGGGGSGYVSGTSTTLTAGSGATAANTADGDYVTGVGAGGSGGTDGGDGWVKLSWS